MMTLLKYDFRKNGNTLLAGLVVLIIAQIAMSLFMSNATSGVLGLMAYVGAGVALYVRMIKTYASNIRSYHRRLLPVTGVTHVLSPIIFGALCGLGLVIIAGLHSFIYIKTKLGVSLSQYFDLPHLPVSDILTVLLLAAWALLFTTVLIFLSISIAGSFRWKTGPWIGIVSFFVLINLVNWLENVIFSGRLSPNGLFHYTEGSAGITITSNGVQWSNNMWGSTIFEIIIVVLLVWLTIYLNTKKVEV